MRYYRNKNHFDGGYTIKGFDPSKVRVDDDGFWLRTPVVDVTTRDGDERIADHLAHPHAGHEPEEQEGEQMSFFQGTPAQIDSAFSDHSLQGMPAAIAMAIGYNRPTRSWNTRQPMASEDLSPNSSPIVKEMLKQNRLTPNPENEEGNRTNDIGDFGASHYYNDDSGAYLNEIVTGRTEDGEPSGWEEVPEHEVARAKDLLRDVINTRKERKAAPSSSRTMNRKPSRTMNRKPQYEQLQLDLGHDNT